MKRYIALINEIAEEMKRGDEVVWEKRPKEMRWCWKNLNTGRERFLRLTEVSRMQNRDDICFETVMDFILGRKNALEAQLMIEKLPKLKAFL